MIIMTTHKVVFHEGNLLKKGYYLIYDSRPSESESESDPSSPLARMSSLSLIRFIALRSSTSSRRYRVRVP